jgi:hypothetical protein
MNRLFPLPRLGLALFLGACLYPAHAADQPAEDPSVAELKVLDADFDRFTKMMQVYDDPYYLPRIRVYHSAIKLRVEAQHKNFDQQKLDDLRYDINQQIQRMSRAMQPLITPVPTGEMKLEVAKLRPSPGNADEVKAALAALDGAISRAEVRARTAPAGPEDPQARITRAKQGRAELGKQFTLEKWIAITKDLETPPRIAWIPKPPPYVPPAAPATEKSP